MINNLILLICCVVCADAGLKIDQFNLQSVIQNDYQAMKENFLIHFPLACAFACSSNDSCDAYKLEKENDKTYVCSLKFLLRVSDDELDSDRGMMYIRVRPDQQIVADSNDDDENDEDALLPCDAETAVYVGGFIVIFSGDGYVYVASREAPYSNTGIPQKKFNALFPPISSEDNVRAVYTIEESSVVIITDMNNWYYYDVTITSNAISAEYLENKFKILRKPNSGNDCRYAATVGDSILFITHDNQAVCYPRDEMLCQPKCTEGKSNKQNPTPPAPQSNNFCTKVGSELIKAEYSDVKALITDGDKIYTVTGNKVELLNVP